MDAAVRVQKLQHSCLLMSAFSTGMHVQGFPEYGPERMGAPITAYNRLSNDQIRVHSNIYNPDYVVVVDETLLDSVDVTEGLKENGAIIINTKHTKEEVFPKLNGYKGDIYTIDARKISLEALGKYFPKLPDACCYCKSIRRYG